MATEDSLMERIVLAAEDKGWSVNLDEGNGEKRAEFEQHTPAGEDFSFSVYYENAASLVKAVRDYASGFDKEQHITDWLIAKRNGVTGIPYFKTLVEDADEIWWMLLRLSATLEKMTDDSWYQVIDKRKADAIIKTLDKHAFAEPVGRFIYQNYGLFVGIDNSGGDAWVEEFQTEAECLLWLSGEKEIDDD